MRYETSCGFVVYRHVQAERQYLLIRSTGGEYGFPKGHTEPGETERETAVRELKEETGLEVRFVEGFRREEEYLLPNKVNTVKRVVFFLGEYREGRIVCQETEVSDAIFVPRETALELLSFETTRKILKEADAYLDTVCAE